MGHLAGRKRESFKIFKVIFGFTHESGGVGGEKLGFKIRQKLVVELGKEADLLVEAGDFEAKRGAGSFFLKELV